MLSSKLSLSLGVIDVEGRDGGREERVDGAQMGVGQGNTKGKGIPGQGLRLLRPSRWLRGRFTRKLCDAGQSQFGEFSGGDPETSEVRILGNS